MAALRDRLRLARPSPWRRAIGVVNDLPRLASSPDARRELREQVLIEQSVGRSLPLGRRSLDLSERVIEIPWVLAHVPSGTRNVLDTGTAYAPLVYQRLLHHLPVGELHAVDLAPINSALRAHRHGADLRALPFANDTFDVTICISTVEHIGLDNTTYGIAREHDLDGDVTALRELGRVTRPEGRLLATVPGGGDNLLDSARQYSLARWSEVVESAGLATVEVECFGHRQGIGWERADHEGTVLEDEGGDHTGAAVICSVLTPVARVQP